MKRNKYMSNITNGKRVLPAASIDGRSAEYRRFRDLLNAHSRDLGLDFQSLTESQRALVRRLSALTCECERMEAGFVQRGGSSAKELSLYLQATNTLKRLAETLGTHKGHKARDAVSNDLSTYITTKQNGKRTYNLAHRNTTIRTVAPNGLMSKHPRVLSRDRDREIEEND